MISKSYRLTLKACIVLLCLASLLGNAGCCVLSGMPSDPYRIAAVGQSDTLRIK